MQTGKMNSQKIKFGITLERYYTGENPDDVGSIAFWEQEISEVFGGMPFVSLYPNLTLRIFDLYHSEIERRRQAGLITLEDLNPATPQCEGGSGLYWGGKFDYSPHLVEIAIYRDMPHQPDATVPPCPIYPHNLEKAKQVIGHEFGHHYMRMSGYGSAFAVTHAHKELNLIYDRLRVKHISSPQESGAEMFQALCGIHEIRGKYSDHKPHEMKPDQVMFLLCWYWMQGYLSSKIFTDITVSSDMIWWKEYSLTMPTPFGDWNLGFKGWYGVNKKWERHFFQSRKWVKA